jgi:predicted dithiol-disulfide oxidoreductase (DUF899 family)
VGVEKEYNFDSPKGKETLADLSEERSQLVVYHFMFALAWDEGCPHCSCWADNLMASVCIHGRHFPCSIGQAGGVKKRMGWSFKWVSSGNSDFNYDYHVSFTSEDLKKEVYYNYDRFKTDMSDREGVSVFYRDEHGNVFHTYSSYSPGDRYAEYGLPLPRFGPERTRRGRVRIHAGLGALSRQILTRLFR